MSHARLGTDAEARRLFDKARDWMARYPEYVDLDLERLRDEAASLLR